MPEFTPNLLIAGPIVRKVTAAPVSVWVATSQACHVTLDVYESVASPSRSPTDHTETVSASSKLLNVGDPSGDYQVGVGNVDGQLRPIRHRGLTSPTRGSLKARDSSATADGPSVIASIDDLGARCDRGGTDTHERKRHETGECSGAAMADVSSEGSCPWRELPVSAAGA